MKKILLICLFLLAAFSNAYALKIVNLIEGKVEFIEVSNKDLNVIVFPVDVKVYTKGDTLEVKIDDKRVFVSFKKEPDSPAPPEKPEEVFFLTSKGTYPMILIPKGIPAETVIAKVKYSEKDKALKWENNHPYIFTLKGLIKAMYINIPPNGYEIEKPDKAANVSKWKGISQVVSMKYIGATMIGEAHTVTNNTKEVVRLQEQEFYNEGVLAVSIDTHELQPSEKTNVYIVKRTVADYDTKGVFDVLGR